MGEEKQEKRLTMDTAEGTYRSVASFDAGKLVREDRIHRRIHANSEIFELEMCNITYRKGGTS
jgi:hypothetical protein